MLDDIAAPPARPKLLVAAGKLLRPWGEAIAPERVAEVATAGGGYCYRQHRGARRSGNGEGSQRSPLVAAVLVGDAKGVGAGAPGQRCLVTSLEPDPGKDPEDVQRPALGGGHGIDRRED